MAQLNQYDTTWLFVDTTVHQEVGEKKKKFFLKSFNYVKPKWLLLFDVNRKIRPKIKISQEKPFWSRFIRRAFLKAHFHKLDKELPIIKLRKDHDLGSWSFTLIALLALVSTWIIHYLPPQREKNILNVSTTA